MPGVGEKALVAFGTPAPLAHQEQEHDRVHPVVHPLLQEMLGFVPPEPPRTVLDIVDAWTTEHARAT